MNKTIFSVGVSILLLWVLIACTPTISETPTQAAMPTQFLDSTIMPTYVIAAITQVSTTNTLSETEPTPSKEQIQEIVGKLLTENSNCTNPCLWGFKPGSIEKEEIFDFFNLLNKKPKSNGKNGDVQYNLSMDYKDYINVSTTFILNQEQSLLIGIRSAIHGLYYPEVANDWAAFRPETILKIYGEPSSIEFDLSYPTEPTTDPTIGYDFIFRYEASHFTVMYTGQRTINRPQLTICPLKDENFESVYLYIGNIPGFNVPAGKPLEDVSSLNVSDFTQLILDKGEDACLTSSKANFNNE